MNFRDSRVRMWVVAICTALQACASATLVPNADGTVAIVVGNGYDEDEALEAALDKGIAHCKPTGKAFAVLSRQSRYQGIDPTVKTAINVAGMVGRQPIYDMGNRSDDWRVELQGKCQ